MTDKPAPVNILLVEDNNADVRMIQACLRDVKTPMRICPVADGVEAMDFLRKRPPYAEAPRPDLIILDLNLPRKSGHELLDEIKTDKDLKIIPVVVLTTSIDSDEYDEAYRRYANCVIQKPMDFDQTTHVIHALEHFWLEVVVLPSRLHG
jgi:two-component system, chemotaxis family, response regulator Rcp1